MQSTDSSLQIANQAYNASRYLFQHYTQQFIYSDLVFNKNVVLGAALTGFCIWAAKIFLSKNKISRQAATTPSQHNVAPKHSQALEPMSTNHEALEHAQREARMHTTENNAAPEHPQALEPMPTKPEPLEPAQSEARMHTTENNAAPEHPQALEPMPTKPEPLEPAQSEARMHTTENNVCLDLAGIAGNVISKALVTAPSYRDDDQMSISTTSSRLSKGDPEYTSD